MSDNDIVIETDDLSDETKSKMRTEEISVAGRELMNTLGRLAREATVRKVTVKSASGKTIVEIPFLLGAVGVLALGPWTAALLGAAWLTRASVLIEYEEAPETMEEALREMPGLSKEQAPDAGEAAAAAS